MAISTPWAPDSHYTNPLIGTLADLMQRNSAARAEGIRRGGEISGQAWSNAGNQIAGSLGALAKYQMDAPQRAQEAQARDLELQVKRGELTQQQDAAKDKGALDTALGSSGDDEASFKAALGQLPGHLRPALTEAWNKSQAARLQHDKARTEADASLNDWVAADAHGLTIVGHDKNPDAVLSLLTDAKGRGMRDADPLIAELQQNPAAAPSIVARLVDRSKTQRELSGQEADRTLRQTTETRAAAQAAAATADKTADNIRADAQATETARHNKAMEGRPVAGAAVTFPGDFTLTGKDFLKTIPLQSRRTVEKLANYDEDPTKVVSMRGADREKVMAWVNQVNPAYDSTMYVNRAPTRKAFTTGTQGQQINAINTAIGHINQITGVATALQNGGFTPANKAWNSVQTIFGADKVTNFDTLKDALAGEVASVLSKSGATVSGIAEAKDKINASNSPTQLAGYVKTLIPIMGSKLSELNYQYHQAMGADDPYSALSPESREILLSLGFDPDKPQIGMAATPQGTGSAATPGGTVAAPKVQEWVFDKSGKLVPK